MRTIELTVPAEQADRLLAALRDLEPLALRLQRGASLAPPGDVVSVAVTNDQLGPVMRIADGFGLGREGGVLMTTAVPLSVVTPDYATHTREMGATTWEELELSIGEDSTMTPDRTLVMFIAGVIAGIGIITGTLHTVIGAMVIAPGFQPFARFALGLINRSGAWRGGLRDVARAYLALAAGAVVAALTSVVWGETAVDAGADSYLTADALVVFWTTTNWPGVAVGLAAGVCGGVLISLNRTVLTAGVMVALALVPSAALVPMALLAGEGALAGRAALRFVVEVVLVLASVIVVFLLKRRRDGRRAVD